MSKFNTQISKVKKHLILHGSITSWEAITKYHATRLSAIIYVLKGQGMNIESVWKQNANSRYTEYQFKN